MKNSIGSITVYDDGSVIGPASYIRSASFTRCCKEINIGRTTILKGAGVCEPEEVAEIISKDLSRWLGVMSISTPPGTIDKWRE